MWGGRQARKGYVGRRLVSGGAALLYVLAGLALCSCFAQERAEPQSRQPDNRIDLSTIGFGGLSILPRVTDDASFTLNFIDDARILVTYNRRSLLIRNPECTPFHDDRIIHAAVIRVRDGRVLREVDWYLHDRREYLWPLGPGKFLLRKMNRLYELDSLLREKPLLEFPQDLLWVDTTPDGRQIIVERQDDISPPEKKPKKKVFTPPRVRVEFFDTDTLDLERVLHVDTPVELQAGSQGLADAAPLSRNTWIVRFGPTAAVRENIAQVRSRCAPDVLHPANNALLIGRCSSSGKEYALSAYSTAGDQLWRAQWKQNHVHPVVRASADGSRFVFSSLTVPVGKPKEGDEDGQDGPEPLDQPVVVFDTASGTTVFSGEATSTTAQQNVAISPDGAYLALLNELSVDIYGLATASTAERSHYEALRGADPVLGTLPPPLTMEPEVHAVSLKNSVFGWAQGSPGTIAILLHSKASPRSQGKQDLPQLEPE